MRPITVSDIPIGFPIEKNIYNVSGTIVLHVGDTIRNTQEQIAYLSQTLFVKIESKKAQQKESYSSHAILEHLNTHPVKMLELIFDKLSLLQASSKLPINFAQTIFSLAKDLNNLYESFPFETLAFVYMRSHPANSILNSIHCALISLLISDKSKTPIEQTLSLCCAALTMNWSSIALQDALVSQKRTPTKNEQQKLQMHPQESYQILMDAGVSDPLWLRIVLEHHENPNATGYPNKLHSTQIHPLSQVLRLTDRYVAFLSSRLHRLGLSSIETFLQLHDPLNAFEQQQIKLLLDSLFISPGTIFSKNQTLFITLQSDINQTTYADIHFQKHIANTEDILPLISKKHPTQLYIEHFLIFRLGLLMHY